MGVYSQGTLSIVHMPTVVFNKDGDTVIRGISGTSLVTKLEVDIITDSILDTATMEYILMINSPNYILSPSGIIRCAKDIKQVASTMWGPTRAPLVMTLVGNANVASL